MREKFSVFFNKRITSKKRKTAMFLSFVALVEILAVLVVSTSAWVESVSSIKIFTTAQTTAGGTRGIIESPIKQQVDLVNTGSTAIDLSEYFRPSGAFHLAGASSTDGKTMFFPEIKGGDTTNFRIGNVNDKNVNYISFTIRTKSSRHLAFDQLPTISFVDDSDNATSLSSFSMADTTGMTDEEIAAAQLDFNRKRSLVRFSVGVNNDDFRVYSLVDEEFTDQVVSSEDGSTITATVYPFSDFIKGKDKLLTTEADGFLSFNMWIQDPTGAYSSYYHNKTLSVSNLKLVTVSPFTAKATYKTGTSFTEGNVGGTVAIENSSYGAVAVCYAEVGQVVHLHAIPSESNGYEFLGWYGTKTDSTVIDQSDGETFNYTVQSANETIYAKFSNEHDLYMKPEYWHDSGTDETKCRYAAFVFGVDSTGSTTGTWYDMSKVTTGSWNDYYRCSYKGNATNVIFCYMNPNSSTNNFDNSNRWLQTFDLRVPSKAGEYGYIVTCRETYNIGRNDPINNNDCGTNKLLGYWKHNYVHIQVGFTSNSDFSTANGYNTNIRAALTNTCRYYTHAYWYNDKSEVNIDGQAYQDIDGNGDLIANQIYEKKVTLTAVDQTAYDFVGWYEDEEGTSTLISTNKEVEITAPDNLPYSSGTQVNTKMYYARYAEKPEAWQLMYSLNGGAWSAADMTQSSSDSDTFTYTWQNFGEGDNILFKIYDAKRDKWYSNGTTYDRYITTTIINADALNSNTSTANMNLTGHKGDYTFSFDSGASKKLTLTAAYGTITITFDCSSFTGVGDDDATIKLACTQGEVYPMTKSGNTWTAEVSSTYTQNFWFNRKNSDGTLNWNDWNAGYRGTSLTYKVTDWGVGSWQ